MMTSNMAVLRLTEGGGVRVDGWSSHRTLIYLKAARTPRQFTWL
jgi:hypothetical protein